MERNTTVGRAYHSRGSYTHDMARGPSTTVGSADSDGNREPAKGLSDMKRLKMMTILTLLVLWLVVSSNRGQTRTRTGGNVAATVIVYDDGDIIEAEDHGFNGAGIIEGPRR